MVKYRYKKTFDDCFSEWIAILLSLIALTVFVIIIIDTKGVALLVLLAFFLILFGPSYLCYLYNNRK